jgi:transposase
MQAEELVQSALGVKQMRVESVRIEADGFVATVCAAWEGVFCSGCGKTVATLYDRRPPRRWRAQDVCGVMLHLEYGVRRVDCPRCGIKTELVPWAEASSRFLRAFEDQTAYLAQKCDKTTVASLLRIAWTTVGSILEAVVERKSRKDRLEGLRRIGIDELSYRKHHEYLTVVVDHDSARVVWVGKDKSRETVQRFFEDLGTERTKALELVSLDMSGSFISALREYAPNARLVFDRFHIQELLNFAVDEVRRDEVLGTGKSTPEGRALKNTRWSLLRNSWNMTTLDKERVSLVQKRNKRLYKAYMMKESLIEILERNHVPTARRKLSEWFHWASCCRLRPLKKLGRTLKGHLDGILAYVQTRLSNGRTEALNGKIRTITRRSYGFHRPESLMALIYLCCSGLRLVPSHSNPLPLEC